MNPFAARKQAALEQKLAALDAEFAHWLDVTKAGGKFEKHHTQVRALTGHLQGLREATSDILKDAVHNGAILEEGRNLESLVLGIRRIWEFFRSKLVQRRDPDQLGFLQLADELAWGCYKPVLDKYPASRREPPLVFLNGGLSPFALSRDAAFPAEAVPGEPLAGSTYEPILQKLPIPVIGVPWHQVAHLPDLPVAAHETGHAVMHDFGWRDDLLLRITTPHAQHWKAWAAEIFADIWGCLALGPAYASALCDFLTTGASEIEGEIASETGKYPTATLRILLCAEVLDANFPHEAQQLRDTWLQAYPVRAMAALEGEVPAIAAALTPDGEWRTALEFTPADWSAAQDAANELKSKLTPTSATSAARLVAAARILYDRDPAQFAAKAYSKTVLEYAQTLIQPGTRTAPRAISASDGKAWFEDFRKWVSPRT